ncbi:uncharacterized protein LOC135816006 [Sycon ciliatum]|uniref:uncharacterized protein LOC135816006 n=1 Tax=Sycon ciliatum TaxID=27933 RepID=UPI0031F5FE87
MADRADDSYARQHGFEPATRRNPDKDKRQQAGRVWEATKSSIGRAGERHNAGRIQSTLGSKKCVAFVFPGRVPDGVVRAKQTLSASQLSHLVSVLQSENSKQGATAVLLEFDEEKVGSRVARGYGQQIYMGTVGKVRVVWPASRQDYDQYKPAENPSPPASAAAAADTVGKQPKNSQAATPAPSSRPAPNGKTPLAAAALPTASAARKDPPCVFLGGLEQTCREADLRSVLKAFSTSITGVSVRCTQAKMKAPGQMVTFAYVKFSSEDSSQSALAFLKARRPMRFSECRLYNVASTPLPLAQARNPAEAEKDAKPSATGAAAAATGPGSLPGRSSVKPASKSPSSLHSNEGMDAPADLAGQRATSSNVRVADAAKHDAQQNISALHTEVSALRPPTTHKASRPNGNGLTGLPANPMPEKAVGRQETATANNNNNRIQPLSCVPGEAKLAAPLNILASKAAFEFVNERFRTELAVCKSRHALQMHWQAGRVSLAANQRPQCYDIDMNMFRRVTEKFIQLTAREYTHFSNTPADLSMAIGESVLDCQGRLVDDSKQLMLVGLDSAVTSSWKNAVDFLRRSVWLSVLQVEFLQRFSNVEKELLKTFGVSVEGFKPGSKRLLLVATDVPTGSTAGSAIRKGKEYVEKLLSDWMLEKIDVEHILSRTASRLIKQRKLPVVLAMFSENPKTRSYLLGGAPSEPVMRALTLLLDGPSCDTVQLPSPPFTAAYIGKLQKQDASIKLPQDMSPACLGDVHVVNRSSDDDDGVRTTELEIRSYVAEDVKVAIRFFTKLAENIEDEVALEAGPAAPSLALYYLSYIITYNDTAKQVIADIEAEHKVVVNASTTTLPCVTLHGTTEARQAATNAILDHPGLLAGVVAKYVSLPTLTMDMVALLRKRFLEIVESKVGVVCLTFQATEEVMGLLKMQATPHINSVIVAIFGSSENHVVQAQKWISSLGPAKLTLPLDRGLFDKLEKEKSAMEDKHVVCITLNPGESSVVIAGLTGADVDLAKQAVFAVQDGASVVTEELSVTCEQEIMLKHKLAGELECTVDLVAGGSGKVAKLHGTKQTVQAAMAHLSDVTKGLRAVHIAVSFPSELATCLESTWETILTGAAQRSTVWCERQEKAFSHSASTPTTKLDCRPVLQLPDSFPDFQIDGQTCFFVLGTDRREFTETLQSIRNAGSSVLKQQIILSGVQRDIVKARFDQDKGRAEDGTFMHLTEKGIHVCAPSMEKLSHAKAVVARWLEKEVTIPVSALAKRLMQAKIEQHLTTLASKLQFRFHWQGEQLEVIGSALSMDDVVESLHNYLAELEVDICTRSLSIAHWLVPQLSVPEAVEVLKELEETMHIVCPPAKDAVAEYQKAVLEEMKSKIDDGKVQLMAAEGGAGERYFVTPPSALIWHMNGVSEEQVTLAGQRLSELFNVPLLELEMCFPGKADTRLCNRVAEAAAEHLVEITVSVSRDGYASSELASLSGMSSCVLTVRGVAPRPRQALQKLQASIFS